jgi:hypothetical protein
VHMKDSVLFGRPPTAIAPIPDCVHGTDYTICGGIMQMQRHLCMSEVTA